MLGLKLKQEAILRHSRMSPIVGRNNITRDRMRASNTQRHTLQLLPQLWPFSQYINGAKIIKAKLVVEYEYIGEIVVEFPRNENEEPSKLIFVFRFKRHVVFFR